MTTETAPNPENPKVESAACGCSGNPRFDGVDPAYKRVLWVVIFINAAMFIVEMSAGKLAGSQALQADALDFLGDALTYGLSLAVIGMSLKVRSTAALLKGLSLLLMGLWVLGSTIYQILILGVPRAEIMGLIGLLALAANLASVLLLMRYKDGDANVRSVWLCSRNDAIGNVAVMVASFAVFVTPIQTMKFPAIMSGTPRPHRIGAGQPKLFQFDIPSSSVDPNIAIVAIQTRNLIPIVAFFGGQTRRSGKAIDHANAPSKYKPAIPPAKTEIISILVSMVMSVAFQCARFFSGAKFLPCLH